MLEENLEKFENRLESKQTVPNWRIKINIIFCIYNKEGKREREEKERPSKEGKDTNVQKRKGAAKVLETKEMVR